LAKGVCEEGELEINCQGIEQEWTSGNSCALAGCIAIRGACCNLDSGSCVSNVLSSQCEQSSSVWHPGASCNQILCMPN
jgi:hypothetical protein